MTAHQEDIDLDRTFLYHQLDSYPWSTDEEFQGGLRAILGSVQDPAQVEHLTLRAKCYYFARKAGTPVDFDGYKNWVESERGNSVPTNGDREVYDSLLESQTTSQPAVLNAEGEEGGSGMSDGLGDAPKPASFAEICALIQEGKPIPGIKDIPDTILEGQASESSVQKRQKPWEKSDTGEVSQEEQPSWMK
jgi:hypothetical protein